MERLDNTDEFEVTDKGQEAIAAYYAMERKKELARQAKQIKSEK